MIEKLLGSSFLFIIGGVIGFFINSWFTWHSQKISQESFYAEHFLKVKAEKLIKTLELLSSLKFYISNFDQTTIEEVNSLIVDLRAAIISIHCFIDQNNYNKLAEFYTILAKTCKTRTKEDIKALDDSFECCFNMISKYLPRDFLFKKVNGISV